MIHHFINGRDPVLDLVAEGAQLVVLVGRSDPIGRDRKRYIGAHYRLVYEGGSVWRENLPRPIRGEATDLPAIDDERWQWAERVELSPACRWTYARAFAKVDRLTLKRWLTKVKKFVGRSLDEAALVAVDIGHDRVSLWTLGEVSLSLALGRGEGCEPWRDGLGRCVVLWSLLAHVVRNLADDQIALSYDPHGACLAVGHERLWLASVEPSVAPSQGTDLLELRGPLERAALYTSTTASLALIQLNHAREPGTVHVFASDGHCAYTEAVAVDRRPDQAEVAIPVEAVIAVLDASKKSKSKVYVGFDAAGRITVESPELRASCLPRNLRAPVEALFYRASWQDEGGRVRLSRETVAELRALVGALVAYEVQEAHVHFAANAVRVMAGWEVTDMAELGDAENLPPLEEITRSGPGPWSHLDRVFDPSTLARVLTFLPGEVEVILSRDAVGHVTFRSDGRAALLLPRRI